MLTTSYHKASGDICHQLPLSCEWGSLQVIVMQGRHIYRAVRSAKCRACRNSAKRFRYTCAPSVGQGCNICGNPFVYGARNRRIWNGHCWEDAPRWGGASDQTVRLH